jgi:hypothetical protein
MKLKILKLAVIGVFLAFAAGLFLFSNGRTQAQSSKNEKKRDGVLERVAGYKNWKQVQKPEKKVDETAAATDVLAVDSLTLGG